jgi:hypothetical protein
MELTNQPGAAGQFPQLIFDFCSELENELSRHASSLQQS